MSLNNNCEIEITNIDLIISLKDEIIVLNNKINEMDYDKNNFNERINFIINDNKKINDTIHLVLNKLDELKNENKDIKNENKDLINQNIEIVNNYDELNNEKSEQQLLNEQFIKDNQEQKLINNELHNKIEFLIREQKVYRLSQNTIINQKQSVSNVCFERSGEKSKTFQPDARLRGCIPSDEPLIKNTATSILLYIYYNKQFKTLPTQTRFVSTINNNDFSYLLNISNELGYNHIDFLTDADKIIVERNINIHANSKAELDDMVLSAKDTFIKFNNLQDKYKLEYNIINKYESIIRFV